MSEVQTAELELTEIEIELETAELELVRKASLGMCGGQICNYPMLLNLLKRKGLIFAGEETQPVNMWIGDWKKMLPECVELG